MDEKQTLGDALPREMARVREILGYYRAAAAFGAATIEADLRAADEAVMSGDLAAMISAYKRLRDTN